MISVSIIILYLLTFGIAQDNLPILSNPNVFKTIIIPYVDNHQLKIKSNKHSNEPFKYAEKIDIEINTIDDGEWKYYNEQFKVWRLNIRSKDAIGMKLLFDQFVLPKGSRLYIYNEYKDMIIGPIDETFNHPDATFGHKLLKGDSIYIELFIPHTHNEIVKFQISNVIHAFEDILGFYNDRNQRNTCGLNVACSEASPYLNQINSVAYLVMNEYICSGALINNTRQDLIPYFLTAYHCVEEETEINSHNFFTFYFRHQSISCQGSQSNYNYSTTGSNTLAWDGLASSDFALLRLDSNLPSYFNAYYAGWSRLIQNQTISVGIHHPSGNPKKINFDNNDTPYACGWYNNSDNTHWCLNWDEGGTEGGSSGSPLFNSNNQIIGQLSGGDVECGGTDLYGKFSNSWDGLNPSKRLRDWLDPDNINIMSLNGTSDGIIDFDGDHVTNDEDIDDNNPYICSDVDQDQCDDCSFGSYNINNDGIDYDNDGLCDLGDLDDDNDGLIDVYDIDDTNSYICSDVDQDGCDDCSSGNYDLFNDGCQYVDILFENLLTQEDSFQLGIYVNNNHPIAGFQFKINSNPNCINLEGAINGAAIDSDFQISTNSNGMVLGFSFTGSTIAPGYNLLTNILFSSTCDCNLCLEDIILTDPNGTELIINDYPCSDINIADIGDINQDSFINIADIVLLIEIILNQYNPSSYEINLSDTNNDNYINVGDVVFLIELIIN